MGSSVSTLRKMPPRNLAGPVGGQSTHLGTPRCILLAEALASTLWPDGGTLACVGCDYRRAFSLAQAVGYIRTGWPKHCGRSMFAVADAKRAVRVIGLYHRALSLSPGTCRGQPMHRTSRDG